MAKILALVVVLIGLIGGAAAGHFLRPPPPEGEEEVEPVPVAEDLPSPEVVSLRELFVVPVLRDGQVWSHVVLSLGIEARQVSRDDILVIEPLLRDGMNEVLYRHASLGGFDGNFTGPEAMTRLRNRLDGAVARLLDDDSARVLVVSMVRQNG